MVGRIDMEALAKLLMAEPGVAESASSFEA